jgi:hypothetical protein
VTEWQHAERDAYNVSSLPALWLVMDVSVSIDKRDMLGERPGRSAVARGLGNPCPLQGSGCWPTPPVTAALLFAVHFFASL